MTHDAERTPAMATRHTYATVSPQSGAALHAEDVQQSADGDEQEPAGHQQISAIGQSQRRAPSRSDGELPRVRRDEDRTNQAHDEKDPGEEHRLRCTRFGCPFRCEAVVSGGAHELLATDEGRVCSRRAAGFCIAVAKRERDLKVMPLASTRERR
jgi:hypothetical protein